MSKDPKYREDWDQEAPKLASLERKEPFEVPNGYFEGLEDRLMAGIAAQAGSTASEGEGHSEKSVRPMAIRWAAALLAGTGILFALWWGRGESLPLLSASEALQSELQSLPTDVIVQVLDEEDVQEHEILDVMGKEAMADIELPMIVTEQELLEVMREKGIENAVYENASPEEIEEAALDELDAYMEAGGADGINLEAFGLDADDLKNAKDILKTLGDQDNTIDSLKTPGKQ